MTEAEVKQIDTILTILSAYPRDQVKSALKSRNAHQRGERIAAGWQIYTGEGEPPAESGDRMRIGSLWYTRERPATPERPMPGDIRTDATNGTTRNPQLATRNAEPATRNSQPATDLSMKPTDKRCSVCGEVMAWEPICPGCTLGRMGFRGRYVCMDDFDHTFYVTKPGVELPNR